MIIGISQDMRRTAVVSVAGHLLLLLLLTAVPFMKIPPRSIESYQVVLISPSPPVRHIARPPVVQPAPTVTPPVAKHQAPAPVERTIPAPPKERMPARVTAPETPKAQPVVPKPERLSDLLHQNMREIALPKEVKEVKPAPSQTPTEPRVARPMKTETPRPLSPLEDFHRPDLPMDSPAPQPSSVPVPRHEAQGKPAVDKNLVDALQKFEDTINKPSTQAPPTPPSAAVSSPKSSRTAEEVRAQLKQLPVRTPLTGVLPSPRETERPQPQVAAPSLRDEVTRMIAKAPVPSQESPLPKEHPITPPQTREVASLAAPSGTRAVTLERCPPKAKQYCPLLEAAINRLWNADYNASIRRVLESAGDSATLVLIEIRPNGLIQNITVQESSGNRGYDLAIQSLLRDQRQFPPLPEELKSENFKAITSFKYTRKT
jgi:TonB family protein